MVPALRGGIVSGVLLGITGMVLGNQYLGAGPVLLFGSERQKQDLLPAVASGELLSSEPQAATSVAASPSARLRRSQADPIVRAERLRSFTFFPPLSAAVRRSLFGCGDSAGT